VAQQTRVTATGDKLSTARFIPPTRNESIRQSRFT